MAGESPVVPESASRGHGDEAANESSAPLHEVHHGSSFGRRSCLPNHDSAYQKTYRHHLHASKVPGDAFFWRGEKEGNFTLLLGKYDFDHTALELAAIHFFFRVARIVVVGKLDEGKELWPSARANDGNAWIRLTASCLHQACILTSFPGNNLVTPFLLCMHHHASLLRFP